MGMVLKGPPGAGKGRQAAAICRRYGVAHISTGDMFRAAMASGSQVGAKAKAYVDRGELVPDDVTIGIVRERLSQPDATNGFVLDGFPRTVPQALGLDELLAGSGLKLDAVVLIEVPEAELVRRAVGRRVCPRCNRVWHLEFNPPPEPGTCSCGGELTLRPDDTAETVRARLAVYRERTEALKDYYAKAGILRVVDGSGSPQEVEALIAGALERCSE